MFVCISIRGCKRSRVVFAFRTSPSPHSPARKSRSSERRPCCASRCSRPRTPCARCSPVFRSTSGWASPTFGSSIRKDAPRPSVIQEAPAPNKARELFPCRNSGRHRSVREIRRLG
jgi:hypothetical protein